MALDFFVTDGKDGECLDSDGITCMLSLSTHEELFAKLGKVDQGFPLLQRFSDFFGDGFVGRESIGDFILEIEHATLNFEMDSAVKQFFGALHSMSVLAWARPGDISAFGD